MSSYQLFLKPEILESQAVGPDLFLSRARGHRRAGAHYLIAPHSEETDLRFDGLRARFSALRRRISEDLMESNEPKRLTLALSNPDKKWVVKELDALIEEWRAWQEEVRKI